MADLERMGRELKCPICLSLLHSAASLTCNHLFCNSCILKSMKSASSCPVCKIPVTRREVRPAPHMDNLVTIYKNMEAASGISLFATQNTKLTDGERQREGDADSADKGTSGTHENHAKEKKTSKRKNSKKIKTGMTTSTSNSEKPSFPAKKRVQVPQDILSETPLKNLKSGGLLSEINKEGTQKAPIIEKERPLQSEKDDQVLTPFFWLREEEDREKISQPTDEDQFAGSTPIPLSFSDLKDVDDENPSNVAPQDEVQDKSRPYLFDSEMFEWTQRPCSPELFSSPSKMQVDDTPEIDENEEELVAGLHELETHQSSADAHKTQFENPNEGNLLANVLQPSVSSPHIRSSDDLNGTKKSRKRGRKAREKANQEQIKEQKDQIDGMDVDSNISLKVIAEEASDYKHKASNPGKSNRRGKRVCFNISTNPTPQTACNVFNRLGVRSTGKTKMAKNSYTSASEQENEKHCSQVVAVKSRGRRSGKQMVDCVHDPAGDLSSMQNQTNEFAGSALSTLSQQMDNNGNASNIGKRKSNLSRKSMSCSTELRTKKSKHSASSTSKTKNDQEIQPNESIKRGTDVGVMNDTSNEKHRPLTDGPVMNKCESHVKKYQCAFCLSSEESEASGVMVHFFDGKPVTADSQGGSKVIHCHRNCTEWAPNVYFEDENAVNLEAEISRSRRIKCSFCGLKGAALGCYEKSCRRSFHVPCAKWTSRCRWDMNNFVMLCPLHASSVLPYEKSGSQQRSKKQTSIEDKSHSHKHDTVSQSRIAFGSYKKIVLCCSALSVQERDVVSEFERVSKTKVSVLKTWDSSVTHVIASIDENGACRRTLKVLLGILEGKWILNIEWIKACMMKTGPVDEEPYEINVDIHGIKDGPRLGRLRALNKQPKLFDGYKFYLMGDFIPSYKGYLQDLVIAAGGTILHRKPVSDDQKAISPDMHQYQTLIIYSLELPDKCDPLKKDAIFTQRQRDAEILASSTGSKVATNTWILNSIAACKLQSLAQ